MDPAAAALGKIEKGCVTVTVTVTRQVRSRGLILVIQTAGRAVSADPFRSQPSILGDPPTYTQCYLHPCGAGQHPRNKGAVSRTRVARVKTEEGGSRLDGHSPGHPRHGPLFDWPVTSQQPRTPRPAITIGIRMRSPPAKPAGAIAWPHANRTTACTSTAITAYQPSRFAKL
jgi:hypothetical protein